MYKSVEIAKYSKFSASSLFIDLHFYYHYKKNRKVTVSFNIVCLNVHVDCFPFQGL